jgi:hypothetical protein
MRAECTSIAVQPVLVSQHTAPAVLGFRSERGFREWVQSSGVPHARRGLDVLVRVEDALRYLVPEPSEKTTESRDEADVVLAALGCERAGRASDSRADLS